MRARRRHLGPSPFCAGGVLDPQRHRIGTERLGQDFSRAHRHLATVIVIGGGERESVMAARERVKARHGERRMLDTFDREGFVAIAWGMHPYFGWWGDAVPGPRHGSLPKGGKGEVALFEQEFRNGAEPYHQVVRCAGATGGAFSRHFSGMHTYLSHHAKTDTAQLGPLFRITELSLVEPARTFSSGTARKGAAPALSKHTYLGQAPGWAVGSPPGAGACVKAKK